jgi:riboflavin synthase
MFTGIILELGEIESVSLKGEMARIRIQAPKIAPQVKTGDSVSISGVCLTAVHIEAPHIEFDAIRTTLARTTLHGLRRGSRVNLEPALRVGDPLGGHLVSGHVDGVGTIRSIEKPPGEWRFDIAAQREVLDFLVERGSIAVDGISLTLAGLHANGFEVAIIPHTFSCTTLGTARAGDPVNLEADMIGRFVARYLGRWKGVKGITMEKLMDEGYLGPRRPS